MDRSPTHLRSRPGIFARHRGVMLATIALCAAGIFAMRNLPITLYPETTKVTVIAYVPYSGQTPQDFREQYGEELENQLKGVEDVDSVEANYRGNSARYNVEFAWNIDTDEATQAINQTMSSFRSRLPSGSEDYGVFSFGGEDTGFLAVSAHSNQLGSEALYKLIEPILSPRLSTIEEAEETFVLPVSELRAEITFDPQALNAHNLHLSDVLNTVENNYRAIPLGSTNRNDKVENIRVVRGVPSIYDVGEISVTEGAGIPLTVADIAEISIDQKLPRQLYQANGERAVLIIAQPKQGGNVKQLGDKVKRIIDEASLPEHIHFTYIMDPAAFIDNAIAGVIRSALLGAFFALLAIILFLGEFKNVFIIFLSIPLATIFSFTLMHLFHISINLISLGGMTLSVGMIIDATVVVMENIHRHRQEHKPRTPSEYRIVINDAVREVRGAIAGGVITSVLVFTPLSFTSPLTNAILGNLARTVIFALSWSLVIALTVVPIAAYYLFRNGLGREPRGLSRLTKRLSHAIITTIRSSYLWALSRLLASPWRIWSFIAVSIALLTTLILTLLPKIPLEIMGKPEADMVVLSGWNSETEDQEELLIATTPLETQIREHFPTTVVKTFTQVSGSSNAQIIIGTNSSDDVAAVQSYLQETFTSDDTWQFDVFPWDPAELPLPRSYHLQIAFEGPDPVQVTRLVAQALDILRHEELYLNVFTRGAGGESTEIELTPRRQVIDAFPSLTLSQLTSTAGLALSGGRSIEMQHEGEEVEIEMHLPTDHIDTIGGIQNLLIPIGPASIPLRHFFDTTTRPGVSSLTAKDGDLLFYLYGYLGEDSSEATRIETAAKANTLLQEQLEVPPGYHFSLIDTRKEITDAINSLTIALIASVVLIFLALGFQFNSVRIPLVILVTIPLGFIGVIISLAALKSTISLNSMLGTILLGGIVVNNAIILIDFYFQHRDRFATTKEALLHAAELRFAPILITTSTTVLGMIPIAFTLTPGTQVLQPLGVSVAGGLLVSTLFTLFMVPAILTLMHPERVTAD